ncbi:ssDNA endonuclease and repair protein rad10 [Knufia obscura]|uniref:SsDNA endonuclease and repair protein rad10 n=1 Tax=Knufia obscura TaxID=1635080 RepID=A0ABR0S290_9EURO|nr:ssDNA endonuclease and repair protein rad10 [Knufia obscura]
MDAEFDDADFLAAASGLDRPVGRQPAANDGTRPKVVQPKPQALPQRQGPSAILVSTRQKGNPILNHVKSLPWEYSDIPCDYVLGATTCAHFLSLKYHRLHPEYIYGRIRQLGKLYNLRILLTMVDIENHEQALQELSKTSMINNFTLILAWSAQEAGRYIELFKSYEHASPSSIRARQAESWQESLTEFVTTPRNINKTDATALVSNFGTLRAAINAEPEELALIPGWGEKKVKNWYTTLREPFRIKRTGRANAQLLRQESSMADDGEGEASEHPGRTAIPISKVPASMSRESTRPDTSDKSRPTSSHKRQRLQELLPDEMNFDNDDEAAFDEAAMLDADQSAETLLKQPLPAADQQNSVTAQATKDAKLSAGVAAALAKYRQSD